jgi:hypothetical protein
VPEKAEGFPSLRSVRDTTSYLSFVAMMSWLAAPDRESLRFFRPITQLVSFLGALVTLNSIALCADSMPARGRFRLGIATLQVMGIGLMLELRGAVKRPIERKFSHKSLDQILAHRDQSRMPYIDSSFDSVFLP